ncbi:MAG: hypothetical protein JNM77_00850 [Pseudonocardia sp.]|nr:hypothetical protein [Pseudonocardia sp.]
MIVLVWVWVGVALWLPASVLVSVVVGRVVRSRDDQVPQACRISRSPSLSGSSTW